MSNLRRRMLAVAATTTLLLPACAPDPAGTQQAVPEPVASTPAADVQDAGFSLVVDPGATSNSTTVLPVAPPSGPASTPTPSTEPTPGASPSASIGAAVEETTTKQAPAPEAVLSPGDSDEKVRELQHRLAQLDWLEGDISAEYDDRTRAAVDGFQSKRGMPALGFVDQATWDALVGMTRTPTSDEMNNVRTSGPRLLGEGDQGDKVKDLQARLAQLDWFSERVTGYYGSVTSTAVRGFQDKRGLPVTGEVDQATLDSLRSMTREPSADELADKPAQPQPEESGFTLDERCMTGRVICVSKSQRQLAWVIDGQVQFTTDVRFGSELTPTREGVFSVGWKSKDHVSSLYHTPMPYALFFSGGQAIHFSRDFAARGYNGASHGCVNVRDKNVAASLFSTARVGDKVIVF